MTYEEREKLVDQIYEKANELKELVSQLEDQRVDFEEREDEESYYGCYYYTQLFGKEIYLERPQVRIYYGHNWYGGDEVVVRSILVKEDELYFDAGWYLEPDWLSPPCGRDGGNNSNCVEENMGYIGMRVLIENSSMPEHEAYLLEQLEFFISLFKGE
jgi:hypothetical protein